MKSIRYLSVLLIIILIIPLQSYQLIDEREIVSYKLDSITPLRESMLIDIIDKIDYSQDLTRVIINDRVLAMKYSDIQLLRSKGLNFMIDQPLVFNNLRDISRFQEISKADLLISNNFTGKNVNIAIVDSGVDFSNLDIREALARDSNNKPIMLDADAQGIVLTDTKFIAKIENGRIVNNTNIVYDDYTSDVYVNKNGVFLRAVRENSTLFKIYNPLYPFLSSVTFNATTPSDWKIGNNPSDYIKSASGVYRMGFAVEVQFHLGRFGLIILPVLVVDSKEPNVYDTIIPDMSDAWVDFAIFELGHDYRKLKFDYDFTDEDGRVIGDGNELLLYDADNDDLPDLSAGILGARVVDLWGVVSNKSIFNPTTGLPNATILEPMDRNGKYFGIMYDFFGHGTAVASTIVSQGINKYNIYNNGTEYNIKGVAPNAKIIPIKALWAGDTEYAWLWAAGFDLVNNTWVYNNKRGDIINNSWSIPVFTLLEYAPGYDHLGALADILSTPGSLDDNYPGILIVSSAGNSGYAHGTISSPASSILSLSVGATTNNVFVGYGFTKNQPRFGNSTIYYNDIAEFSSKGPLVNGYPKPEIVATGAYAFVPMLINIKHLDSDPVWLFGGTSMAAPIVSGAASLVIQALREKGIEPTPSLIKSILLSNAKDINNEPFTQGAGVLDLTNVLQYINNDSFIVYTNYIYDIPNTQHYNDIFRINYTYTHQSSVWYAGFINRNESREEQFYIHNPDDNILLVNIRPTTLELIKRIEINGTTTPRVYDPILNTTGGFITNYIRLNKTDIPSDTELMIIRLRFPFETFMNMSEIYAHHLAISSLYLYEWSDINNDNTIAFNEIKLVNRGGAYGTVQDISIHKPLTRIKDNMLIGVYPVPKVISFWTGVRDINATAMNYTLTIDLYKKSQWDMVSSSDTLLIKPNSTKSFKVKISVPMDTPYSIYQGYLTISSSKHVTNIPISFSIPVAIDKKDIPFVILNNSSDTLFYGPSLTGSFDMSSRFNSGEWKFYHLNVSDPSINTLSVKVIWEDDLTSISIFAIDPNGKIIATSVPAGVFQTFIRWGSNDWLGSGALGSGAFYPSGNFGNNTSVIYIPINGSGIYTLMLHNTLFNAKNLTEPLRIELKASTILPDMEEPSIEFDIPRYTKGGISIPVNIYDKNIESVRYAIDGKEQILYNNNIIIDSNMSDGLHTLQIYARDSVGNTITKSASFIIDNREPDIIFDIPDKIFSGIIEINVQVIDDNLGRLSIKLPDGSEINNTRFTLDTRLINDGKYEIMINATDLAGNNSILIKDIDIDNTLPLISLEASKSDKIIGVIDILYNVNDPNLDSILLSIDNLSIALDDNTGIYKLDTSSLNDGEHEITIIAKDLANNEISKSIKINTINKEVLVENSRNYGVVIGIIIGGIIAASILTPLYLRKRRFINY